jgi:ActR/RegA family two-component response regulator
VAECKACFIDGCGRPAVWSPKLHLWPEGHPKLDRYKARLLLHTWFCEEHRRGATPDVVVPDDLWAAVARRFLALGRLAPDRTAVEVAWATLAAEPAGRGADSAGRGAIQPNQPGRGLRILVVEDEWLIAAELEAGLAVAGHAVVGPAASVAQALALADATPPEFALVDLNLGAGGDGAEAARLLMERHGCPSLFLTGLPDRARANEDAALGVIAKPADPKVVLAAIETARHVLAGKPRGSPPQLVLFGTR